MAERGQYWRGARVTMFSYAGGFILQGAYFVVLARTLGTTQYGQFAGALAIATLLSPLAGLGGETF